MTEGIKTAAVGVICAALCLLIRELRPELAPFAQAGGITVIAVLVLNYLKTLLEQSQELFGQFDVLSIDYLSILIKVLGIAVITKTASDICTDSGSTALAGNVELAGKVIILALCFSLIKTVAGLAGGLIG